MAKVPTAMAPRAMAPMASAPSEAAPLECRVTARVRTGATGVGVVLLALGYIEKQIVKPVSAALGPDHYQRAYTLAPTATSISASRGARAQQPRARQTLFLTLATSSANSAEIPSSILFDEHR